MEMVFARRGLGIAITAIATPICAVVVVTSAFALISPTLEGFPTRGTDLATPLVFGGLAAMVNMIGIVAWRRWRKGVTKAGDVPGLARIAPWTTIGGAILGIVINVIGARYDAKHAESSARAYCADALVSDPPPSEAAIAACVPEARRCLYQIHVSDQRRAHHRPGVRERECIRARAKAL